VTCFLSITPAGFFAMPRRRSRVIETGVELGDFRIERRLGAGGMGIVYRARQVSLDRTVALKVLVRTGRRGPLQMGRGRAVAHVVLLKIRSISAAEKARNDWVRKLP
jgi:hypothetical protein